MSDFHPEEMKWRRVSCHTCQEEMAVYPTARKGKRGRGAKSLLIFAITSPTATSPTR